MTKLIIFGISSYYFKDNKKSLKFVTVGVLSFFVIDIALSLNFLFLFTQIKSESFLEDLNNVLNAGDVPNIFAQDELDTIFSAMKPVVLDLGLQPTKANLYSAFTKRVRANTHSVVCMR